MNITILAVGHKMPQWVEQAVAEYAKRFTRDIQFHLQEIKPEKRSAGIHAERGMAAEETRILAAIPPQSFLVVLDEHGQAVTSMALSACLQKWQQQGRHVCFVVGGADGLTAALKARADLLLRLSSLTLPHGMVRVLLTEQLYRAQAILHGHPYHRE